MSIASPRSVLSASVLLVLAACASGPQDTAATAANASTTAPASAPADRPVDAALMAAATAAQPEVVKTLERLVTIETGTGDAQGMTAMGRLLEDELKSLGATV